MFNKYVLFGTMAIFITGCGGGAEQAKTAVKGEQITIKEFKSIQVPKDFQWDNTTKLSFNLTVNERVVKKNSDNTVTAYITPVENSIVTLGYKDANITTVRTNLNGEVTLTAKVPSSIKTINLFATSNGFTQRKEILLQNINTTQTILIERSPEPTQAELDQEGK